MSVLIKDMEMPKGCLECPFEDSPEFDSYCIAIGNEFIGKWEALGTYKPDWCPLAEPKTGEWMLKEHLWECDQCGCRINRANPLKGNVWNYNYCPNCGADMRKGDNNGNGI